MKKGSYAYTLIFVDAAEGHFLKITMILAEKSHGKVCKRNRLTYCVLSLIAAAMCNKNGLLTSFGRYLPVVKAVSTPSKDGLYHM